MNRRGSYAKGVAKREEILTTALEVIAREGLRRTSIRELADAAGLSQAGLLHYFDSKEELYTAILRERDEVNIARFAEFRSSRTTPQTGADPEREDPCAVIESLLDLLRQGTLVPGLAELSGRLSVDAVAAEHPAHDYFLERRQRFRDFLTATIAALQTEGKMVTTVPPETLAVIVLALADGLQTHWLLDPRLDMAATIEALFTALDTRERIES